eukprot:15439518-Alexandrium_andersonii.AAC.1
MKRHPGSLRPTRPGKHPPTASVVPAKEVLRSARKPGQALPASPVEIAPLHHEQAQPAVAVLRSTQHMQG